MSDNLKLKLTKDLKHIIVYLIIIAISFLMPQTAEITKVGWRIIGVFVAAVYGWSMTKELWPGMLSIFMIPLTGAMNVAAVLAGGIGFVPVIFVALIFVFIGFLQKFKVSEFMASWLLTRKFLKGRPWLLAIGIFVVAFLVCSLVNSFIGVLLTWQIIYDLSKKAGYQPRDKTPTLLLVGVALLGVCSLIAFPWSDQAVAMLGFVAQMVGPYSAGKYVFVSLSFGLFTLIVYCLLCAFVFRMDVKKLKDLDPKSIVSEEDLRMTPARKLAFIILLAVFILFVLNAFLPAGNFVKTFLSTIGLPGILMFVFVFLAIFKVDDKPVFQFREMAHSINWNVVFIMATCMPLGTALVSDTCGITAFINGSIVPLLTGMPKVVFFLVLAFVIVILTNFLNNIPVCILFLPIAAGAASAFGVAPEQLAFLVITSSVTAWMTPSSSPLGTLLYGNAEWIAPKNILKYGLPVLVIITVITALWNCFVVGMLY